MKDDLRFDFLSEGVSSSERLISKKARIGDVGLFFFVSVISFELPTEYLNLFKRTTNISPWDWEMLSKLKEINSNKVKIKVFAVHSLLLLHCLSK